MIQRREFLRGACAAAIGLCLRPAPARCDDAIAATRGTPMLTRPIGNTGESLPVIGMGTWQTFDPPRVDRETLAPLAEVMRLFHDAGGRAVDSSPMYGKAEEVAGELSTQLGLNSDLFIATKVWTRGERQGIEQMRRSAQRLRRETIDLIQIHNLLDWRSHLPTLRAMKDAGEIRYIGITHYQVGAFDDMAAIMKSEPGIDFIQIPYSVKVRAAEARLLPLAKEKGIAVLVNRPFEGGGMFQQVRNKPLPDFAKEFAQTWAQAFLKIILANDAITAVLPATSKPHHMQDNVHAGFGRLPTPEERERLVDLL